MLLFKGITNFAQEQKAVFNKVSLKNSKILYLLTEIANFTRELYRTGIDVHWCMLVYAVSEFSEVYFMLCLRIGAVPV